MALADDEVDFIKRCAKFVQARVGMLSSPSLVYFRFRAEINFSVAIYSQLQINNS